MEARETLERLIRLQELANASREADLIVTRAPERIEEIEARFRERNAEYVAVRDRDAELEQDQKNRTVELATLEQHRDKYMADLMEVKNQREYSAMLREIDSVKAQIAGHEEAIFKDIEAIDELKVELAKHEEHIMAEREKVTLERGQVEAEAAAARRTLKTLRAERSTIESELTSSMTKTIAKLEATRQGIFLTQADNGTCLSCFVRIRPQVFQEIKGATVVHSCDSCRRFLYHPPTFETKNPSGAGASDAPSVETVNGGAA